MQTVGKPKTENFGLGRLIILGFTVCGAGLIATTTIHFAMAALLGEENIKTWVVGEHAILPPWLATLSGVINLVVAGIAAYVVRFAKIQADEARRARVATLYLEVKSRWDSEAFTKSRAMLGALTRFYRDNSPTLEPSYPTLGDYIAAVLLEMRETDFEAYLSHTHCLDGLEELGMLCRESLLDHRLLVELVGAQVAGLSDRLTPFCLKLRQHIQNPLADALYANTLWLFDECRGYEPFRYP